MNDLPLFNYPKSAGWKEPSISRDAARRIEGSGKAATLRELVRLFFENGGEATADELASLIGESPFSIRPRCAELRLKGIIEPTGVRRRNPNGGTAHVWRRAK